MICCGDVRADRCGSFASEPVVRRLGHELLKVLPVAVLDALADVGGADGAARDGEARDDAALDAEFRQFLAHHFVVEARDLTEGFLADVAAADGERFSNLGEQR